MSARYAKNTLHKYAGEFKFLKDILGELSIKYYKSGQHLSPYKVSRAYWAPHDLVWPIWNLSCVVAFIL